jgi:TonB family protein
MKWFRIPLMVAICIALFASAGAQENQPGTTHPESSATDVAQQIQLGPLTHTVKLSIPRKLRKTQLVAVVSATMATDGTLQKIQVLGGDQDFTRLAVSAVQQWRCASATLNGKPVDAKVFVTVQSIKGKVDSEVELDTLPTEPTNSVVGEEVLKVDPHSMKVPKAVYAPDPQYSERARRARYSGQCVLGLVVGRDGNPKAVWVVKKLGLGLDQKALDAVRQWKFDPATKDGEPVAVAINVEVTFRLY